LQTTKIANKIHAKWKKALFCSENAQLVYIANVDLLFSLHRNRKCRVYKHSYYAKINLNVVHNFIKITIFYNILNTKVMF
jgi:hypothetical protein